MDQAAIPTRHRALLWLPITQALIAMHVFAMLYPDQAVISKLGGCVLAG